MTRTSFTRPILILISALTALALAACGATAPGASWAGLAVNDKLAYVAYGPHLYAVNLSNGKQAWAFPPIPESGSGGGGIFSFLSPSNPVPNSSAGNFFADPGLNADVLLVGGIRPSSSHSGVLFGLNPATGEPKWCLAFDDKAARPENNLSLACPISQDGSATGFLGVAAATDNRLIGGITLANGVAYFGLASGWVFAVNAVDNSETKAGTVLWSKQAEHAVWAAPRVEGETVFVTSLDHFIYAFNRSDGQLKWKTDLGAAIAGTPAVADGTVYIGSFDNKLHALDAQTGKEKWKYAAHQWIWGGPVMQDGIVYFADLAGTVFAVDAQTGDKKWEAAVGGAIRASPAVTTDTVYIGTKLDDRNSQLVALNLTDGKPRWTPKDVKGQLLTTPMVVSDTILITPFQGENLLVAYTTAGEPTNIIFAPSK